MLGAIPGARSFVRRDDCSSFDHGNESLNNLPECTPIIRRSPVSFTAAFLLVILTCVILIPGHYELLPGRFVILLDSVVSAGLMTLAGMRISNAVFGLVLGLSPVPLLIYLD
jgi:hypothetical protein